MKSILTFFKLDVSVLSLIIFHFETTLIYIFTNIKTWMKVRFSFLVAKGYITHLNDFFSPATSRFASNLATCFIFILKFEDVQI